MTPATGPIPTIATNTAANIKSGTVRTIFKMKRKTLFTIGFLTILRAANKENGKATKAPKVVPIIAI